MSPKEDSLMTKLICSTDDLPTELPITLMSAQTNIMNTDINGEEAPVYVSSHSFISRNRTGILKKKSTFNDNRNCHNFESKHYSSEELDDEDDHEEQDEIDMLLDSLEEKDDDDSTERKKLQNRQRLLVEECDKVHVCKMSHSAVERIRRQEESVKSSISNLKSINSSCEDHGAGGGTFTQYSSSKNKKKHGYNNNNGENQQPPYHSQPAVIIFGFDLSGYSDQTQFLLCAGGVFFFTVGYGYLQELIAVGLFCRQLALFLAVLQFIGYSFWSFVLSKLRFNDNSSSRGRGSSTGGNAPIMGIIGVGVLKACDLCLTNMAMEHLNYPAKTLIKSSKTFFTMITGILLQRKRYSIADYAVVSFLVLGLAIFLHADSASSFFHPIGVAMLCGSLFLDGMVMNWSEYAMNKYNVGHDTFNFQLYSCSLLVTFCVALANGQIHAGIAFLSHPGTMDEMMMAPVMASALPITDLSQNYSWTVSRKAIAVVMFATLGVFGASCGGAITKSFGAFATSITSTVRKATTIFLSFVLFHNECTFEHIQGMGIFFLALTMKSIKAGRAASRKSSKNSKEQYGSGSRKGDSGKIAMKELSRCDNNSPTSSSHSTASTAMLTDDDEYSNSEETSWLDLEKSGNNNIHITRSLNSSSNSDDSAKGERRKYISPSLSILSFTDLLGGSEEDFDDES
mmetsp:Transcript_21572/g.26425  ORF Transcript_21572/g.26425 Transcript_21572/m.26425 type:complete len:682 (-) Transcript_21572:477-2522(-)